MIFKSFFWGVCYGSNLDLEKLPRPRSNQLRLSKLQKWGTSLPLLLDSFLNDFDAGIARLRVVPRQFRNSQSLSTACNIICRFGEGRGTISGGVSSSKAGNGEPGLLHQLAERWKWWEVNTAITLTNNERYIVISPFCHQANSACWVVETYINQSLIVFGWFPAFIQPAPQPKPCTQKHLHIFTKLHMMSHAKGTHCTLERSPCHTPEQKTRSGVAWILELQRTAIFLDSDTDTCTKTEE